MLRLTVGKGPVKKTWPNAPIASFLLEGQCGTRLGVIRCRSVHWFGFTFAVHRFGSGLRYFRKNYQWEDDTG